MIRQGSPRRREPDHKLLQRVEWPVTVCRIGGLLDSSSNKPAIAAGEASLVRRCFEVRAEGIDVIPRASTSGEFVTTAHLTSRRLAPASSGRVRAM